MTIDREKRSGEAEGDEQPEGGIVYLDWVPHEGRSESSQRVDDVLEVEVREGVPDDYDQGELVLHRTDGVGVFDRNALRGFRAREGVRVPYYEQRDDGDDSATEGAEQ